MILTADYHTHTPYSHGKNTVFENVAKAKEIGLKEIAITDHGFSHIVYGLRRKETAQYISDCQQAEKEYGVKVLVGITSSIVVTSLYSMPRLSSSSSMMYRGKRSSSGAMNTNLMPV